MRRNHLGFPGLLLLGASVAFGASCSSSGKGSGARGTGGSTTAGQGGSTSVGGTTSARGSSSVGGGGGQAGASASGGGVSSGGVLSTGGSSGESASGGSAGQPASGGSASSGGIRGDGGTSAKGGSTGVSGTGGSTRTSADSGATIDGGTQPTGCSSSGSSLAKGDSTHSIPVGQLARTYLLHVPASYAGTSAVPLVLDFHGMGDTPERQKSMSGFAALSDSQGFIIAWPTGIDQAWNFGPCCTCSKTVDDLGFAKAIVAEIEGLACIDAKRVYANGFSIGAAMTNYLACNAADVFAAATPSASDLLGSDQTPCNPVRPISVLTFRGTADTTVPYAGGSAVTPNSCPATLDLLGAVASFNKWSSIDGCTGTVKTTTVTNPNGTLMLNSQCTGGVEVGLYTIQGGGHSPGPGSVAWDFLKSKSLP
jgi:poly(3-hydroxybutyrate) depolymerase